MPSAKANLKGCSYVLRLWGYLYTHFYSITLFVYRTVCNICHLSFPETPLTTAAVMDNATEVIMFLVNGGAYMDFRNRNGFTAVHRAAAAGRAHNIKVILA